MDFRDSDSLLPPLKSTESGGALLVIILSILLVATIALVRSQQDVRQIIVDAALDRYATQAKAGAVSQVLSAALDSHRLSLARFECLNSVQTRLNQEFKRQACLLQNMANEFILAQAVIDGSKLGNLESFPMLDYGKLLYHFEPCAVQFTGRKDSTSSGFKLTKSALISNYTCQNISPENFLAVRSNLDISSPTIFNQPKIISALGYIEFVDLDIRQGLILVAAGDLKLGTLHSDAAQVAVTLVSASGVVKVDQVTPNIALRVLGKQGVDIPSNSLLGSGPLPEVLKREIVSVSRVNSQIEVPTQAVAIANGLGF